MKRLLASIPLLTIGLILSPSLVAQTTMVDHLTMNQWVCPSEVGLLTGRVFLPGTGGQVDAVKGVNVAVTSRNGEVHRGKTNSAGEFTIDGIVPGVYSLTARGENVFACCAMHVIDDDMGGKFPSVVEVSIANVDYTIVKQAVIRYVPPKASVSVAAITEASIAGIADQVCGGNSFRVSRSDGGMNGRLYLAGADGTSLRGAAMNNVFIFKDGMEIDRAVTEEGGHFTIENLPAGQYSLLAVGSGGIALVSFELVDEVDSRQAADYSTANDSMRLTSLLQPPSIVSEVFAIQVAPMPEVIDAVESSEYYSVQCRSIDGPVTITQPDGSVVTEEGTVSFMLNSGNQTISSPDGQVLYEGVQVVPECPGQIIEEYVDDGLLMPGEVVMDGFGAPTGAGYTGGYGGGTPYGGGGGYGGGGSGGGGGGFGGIGAIAGLAAIGAIAGSGGGGGGFINTPTVASPAIIVP